MKKVLVILLALAMLAAFGSIALAQNTAGGSDDGGRRGRQLRANPDTVFKVPSFQSMSDSAVYLVRGRNLTVSGRDCCLGGDTWGIRVVGLLGFGSSTTRSESSPPGGCTPPTSGYSGAIASPAWFIGLVIVSPVSVPGGFPGDMYVRFVSPSTLSVEQRQGGASCGL